MKMIRIRSITHAGYAIAQSPDQGEGHASKDDTVDEEWASRLVSRNNFDETFAKNEENPVSHEDFNVMKSNIKLLMDRQKILEEENKIMKKDSRTIEDENAKLKERLQLVEDCIQSSQSFRT